MSLYSTNGVWCTILHRHMIPKYQYPKNIIALGLDSNCYNLKLFLQTLHLQIPCIRRFTAHTDTLRHLPLNEISNETYIKTHLTTSKRLVLDTLLDKTAHNEISQAQQYHRF